MASAFNRSERNLGREPLTVGEFFEGWSRKVIAAVIVLSLPICLWWLRSNFVNDDFTITLAKDFEVDVYSTPRSLNLHFDWVAVSPHGQRERQAIDVFIHYTYVVLPVVLLSAYLALTRPRSKKPGNPQPPV